MQVKTDILSRFLHLLKVLFSGTEVNEYAVY
nr:MAG TPA: hypothetical protein [Caudoviricetes sp.]